jgi:hypothetical protein
MKDSHRQQYGENGIGNYLFHGYKVVNARTLYFAVFENIPISPAVPLTPYQSMRQADALSACVLDQ